MTSRLDRLFVLLESGSSSVTRRLAAKQLGEAQRLHPHELHALLSRAATLLRSGNWDTRIAASQAIEAVLQQLPPWDPLGLGNVGKGESEREHLPPAGRLTLSSLDINKVLAGAPLAACEGKEFDMEDETHGTDNLEKIACQRQLLNARLGFGGGGPASYVDEAISEIFTNDDLTHAPLTPTTPTPNSRKQVDALMSGSLSSREMNRARRKARQAMCKQSGSTSNDGEEPELKKARFEMDEASIGICEVYGVPDATGSWGDTIDWPLEGLCERLWADLFSARWESRHGAATALREVLKVFGKGAGKSTDMAPTEMESQHQLWLEDAAVRLLCVLALDRLGDFVSDQVVAPVRETCAQGLGLVLQDMTVWNVQKALSILVQMLGRPEWEARHGGLLGIKYILAVREDLVNVVLPQVFPHIQRGLGDPMDDVGAVAASALIPVAPQLARFPQALGPLVSRLWDLLLDQDELASACNSFMGLLAAILSLPQASSLLQSQPLSELVPRLWPFLCHNTSSVRRATLQTLRTLTQKTTLNTNETIKIEKKEFIEEQNDIIITDETLKLEEPDLKMKVEQDSETVPNGGAEDNVVNGLTNWPHELLQEALRHVFQRVLLEHVPEIQVIVEQVWSNLIRNSPLSTLLHAACPCVASWLCLTMHPPRVAFDPGWLIHARSLARDKKLRKGLADGLGGSPEGPAQKWFLGGSETTPLAVREQNVIRARCMASRMLGELSCYLVKPMPGVEYTTESDSPVILYVRVILTHLQSRSALQRLVVGLVLGSWAKLDPNSRPCPTVLAQALHQTLSENVYYDEIAVTFTRLLQDTRDFLSMMKHYKMDLGVEMSSVLNLEQIAALSGTVTQNMLLRGKLKPKVAESLEERRRSIQGAVNQTSSEQFMLSVSTLAAQAGAVTQLHCIPSKLNPVVRPLMEALKRETLEPLQQLSACHIAQLLDLCAERDPCPNNKVVSNLCIFVSSDSEFTPKVNSSGEGPSSDSGVESLGPGGERSRNATPTPVTVRGGGAYCGILTLDDQLRMAERAAFRRSNSTTGRGPGRPPVSDLPIEELIPVEDEQTQQARTARRGGTFAIRAIAEHFGADLPARVPQLWDVLQGQLIKAVDPHNFEPLAFLNNDSAAEHLVGCLTALEVTASALHCTLLPDLMGAVLPRLAVLLGYPYKAVRHMASRSLAVLAQLDTLKVMEEIVSKVVPRLGAIECDTSRQGAAEALACVIDKLQTRIVPYVVLLVVPLLGRMSDPEQCVRMMCTHSFARLVQLFPLDGVGSQDPPGASPQLCALRAEHREFIEQLFRPQDIPDYVVPVPVKAELRSYQQSGVNWLAFLNKYRLHGVLCDDMGLGKTLQSICMLAGDHYNRIKKYNIMGAVDNAPLPSLVICPPTLTGHWVYEVKKFLSTDYLRPLQYVGPPQEREKLRPKFKSHNLIVASYDIVRKDIEFFSSIKWNYCILDEGHVIKNGKTKSSKAVKQLIANHRLILSGTPIQNNVLELWSLFDFLMPGFLGTERQFTAKYSRPILASRDPKSSPKEQEAGALAMESLHRQVLPFLLRRMKEDVLQDLPPKITQDYYCDLSPLQERLYEDFSRSHLPQNLQGAQAQHTHVFQALRYLQNVCNHPKLVLTAGHPEYSKVIKEVQQQRSSLDDIQHSAKLQALKQLLLDCGIGHPAPMHAPELCVNQHRALVFCQLKSMLDIIEKDLFRVHMPALTYLRLDGSIAPAQRHAVVTRFNNDPSIDVLLLTTQVGGLGLNLTGADTVVFVEHDWNPMRDLQAMDRAHRIGQKRVVNVYRLITRATLEEKIMGLQKFKLLTANTIISNENASLETMGTDQLLDLFSLSDGTSGKLDNANSITGNGGQLTAKSVLESLPELWEDKQYEEEYDMSQFVNSLRK